MVVRGAGSGLPFRARAVIVCAALAAAVLAAPALLRYGSTDWAALLPLAALYALIEYLPRCWLLGHRIRRTVAVHSGSGSAPAEVCGPVLLTAVFLLPPEAAACVPPAGALLGRVAPRHVAARRSWHAAELGLAAWAAGRTQQLLLGPAAREASTTLPSALLPACATALVFWAVLWFLDGVILVTAERCSPRTAWRGPVVRGLVPYLVHGVAGLMMAVLWRSPYGPVAALFVMLPMSVCCWAFAQYHRERAAHQATIRALVQAVDIKDRYTRGHSERVGRASVLIARELGMGDDRTELLRFAGILHDVGKLGVPTRLLRKDGPLTALERQVIELHPEYGHEIVRGIGFLGEARSAILHHHERLDGSGYPYGLTGPEIPEPARVVAVADAFDAMTSTRSYRRARPVAAAVEELRRCSGTQFDARMVGALARALDRHGWSHAATADHPDAAGERVFTAGGNVPPARAGDTAGDAAGSDAGGPAGDPAGPVLGAHPRSARDPAGGPVGDSVGGATGGATGGSPT